MVLSWVKRALRRLRYDERLRARKTRRLFERSLLRAAAYHGAHDPVLTVDVDSLRIVDANASALRRFGFKRTDLRSRHLQDVCSASRAQLAEYLQGLFLAPSPHNRIETTIAG